MQLRETATQADPHEEHGKKAGALSRMRGLVRGVEKYTARAHLESVLRGQQRARWHEDG